MVDSGLVGQYVCDRPAGEPIQDSAREKRQPMEIPAGPEDLSADWLTSALRKGGAISKASVTSFECGPLGEGGGHYGQIARLRLGYELEEAGAPHSLVAKFSSATPKMRERPNTIAAYEREVRFYQNLVHQTSLPTPTCYYSDVNTETGFHILLLEDLAPARSRSRVAGCSLEHAELAIHQIANFHATWWETPQLEEICWLTDVDFDAVALSNPHDRWWPDFLRQAEHHLPDHIKEIGERLGHHRADILRHFRTSPRTLLHGDYSLDNLIFGTPEGGVTFAVVDWQRIGRGRGISDVAWFLGDNLHPEDRRAIEMEILRAYYQILVDNGVQTYTFEQCLHDYRLSLLNRFGSLISTIAVMPFTTEQIREHIDVLLPRNIAAILDHDAGELLG